MRAIIVITQLDRAGITTIYNKPLDSINQPVQLNATRILNTLLYYELLSLTETEKIYTLVGNEGSLMPIATMYSFYPSIRLVAFPAHQVSGRCKPELFKTCNWHPVVYHCELSSARPFFQNVSGDGEVRTSSVWQRYVFYVASLQSSWLVPFHGSLCDFEECVNSFALSWLSSHHVFVSHLLFKH